MPKIPIPQIPQGQRGVPTARTLKYSGAPDLNWKTEGARAITKAGEILGDFVDRSSTQLMKWGGALQDAENNLASREYLAAYAEHQKKLNERMAQSPGAVEEFGKWAAEADKEWEKSSKVYTDRMSEKFRSNFLAEQQINRTQAIGKRTQIAYQARATRIFNGYKDNIEKLCQNGEFEEAYATVGVAGAGEFPVFSPEQIRQYNEKYIPQMQNIHQLKTALANNDFSVLEKLEDEKNFSALTPQQRKEWQRTLKMKENENLVDEYQKICADVNSTGNFPYTPEQMKQFRENKSWSDKKYNMFNALYETHQKSAKQAGEKLEQDIFDDLKGQISLLEYPHPNDLAETKLQIIKKIQTAFPKSSKRQAKLVEHMEAHFKNDPLEKSENGRSIKKKIIDDIKSLGDEKEEITDTELIRLRIEMLAAARQLVRDPKTDNFDVMAAKIDGLKKLYCDKKLKSIFNPNTGKPYDPEKYGKVFNSREMKKYKGPAWGVHPAAHVIGQIMTEGEIEERKKAGEIDKADIVDSRRVRENGVERKVWILEDGRRIYADEYEQQGN